MNDNVLLIGASGFVGTRLLEAAIADFNIKNTDKQQESLLSRNHTDWRCSWSTGTRQGVSRFWHCCAGSGTPRWRQPYFSPIVMSTFQGTRNVLAHEKMAFKISSLPVPLLFSLVRTQPWRSHPSDPFNHYGKVEWQAEEVLREWYNKAPTERSLTIIRPTVIFGERNRGNVYNLLETDRWRQVCWWWARGLTMKSMADVGNIVEFIKYKLKNVAAGYEVL